MRHNKLKRQKRPVDGFGSLKGKKIRQWVFGMLYGLLLAF